MKRRGNVSSSTTRRGLKNVPGYLIDVLLPQDFDLSMETAHVGAPCGPDPARAELRHATTRGLPQSYCSGLFFTTCICTFPIDRVASNATSNASVALSAGADRQPQAHVTGRAVSATPAASRI